MNRKPTFLRRSLAVAGAAFVGLAAAVALASPASAHHSEIKGVAECDTSTGLYNVTWTVNVDAPEEADHYKLVSVDAKVTQGDVKTPVAVDGIVVTEAKEFPHPSNQPLVGTHTAPGDATKVALAVRAMWNNHYQEDTPSYAAVELDGKCEPVPPEPVPTPEPSASAEPACDYLVVNLENGANATKKAIFVVTAGDDFKQVVAVEPNAKGEPVKVPAELAAKGVTVTVKDSDYSEEFTWEDPGNCGEPEGAYKVTCDDITFALTNPKDGAEVEITFTPSTGEAVTRTVGPGEEMEPVVFAGSDGLKITISAEGEEDLVVDYDAEKPTDCDEGTGGGGPLPVTGPKAGMIAGGAGVLLALGAGLFMLARRRRIRFSA